MAAVCSSFIAYNIERGGAQVAFATSSPSRRACRSSSSPSVTLLKTRKPGAVAHRSSSRPLQPITAITRHYLVEKVSGDELNKLLDANRESSVVVGFYATWCGPCITLAQELERLAVEFQDTVKFVKVDTDEEYELANKMQVRGLPTIIFVSKNTEKRAIRTEGVLPRDLFRDIIQKL